MTKTTSDPIPVSVGDVLHVLCGGLLAFGLALKRGDVITVTGEMVQSTIDRNGDSWCSDLSEAGQLARWGDVRFGLGAWPQDLMPWLPGSPEAFEAREEARKRAHRLEDPHERAEALAEVQRVFGSAPTSRTLNSAADPSARLAQDQRDRLDAGGLRVRSNYSPTERA